MVHFDLELLENVELRFAMADNETKLQSALSTFLSPVLLKLDSSHAQVKQKVMGICSHVNARIKDTTIQLPIHSLIGLLNGNHGHAVKSFALVYLDMGFSRLPDLVI